MAHLHALKVRVLILDPTKNDVSSNFMMDLKIMISQDDETGLIHLQSDERRTVYDPFLGEIQD